MQRFKRRIVKRNRDLTHHNYAEHDVCSELFLQINISFVGSEQLQARFS